MDHPFSIEEVKEAIKNSPSGNSPGPDGLTPKFYKKLLDELGPFLTKVFNSIDLFNGFPKKSLEATITVIPKEGTDTLANFLPISLIYIDINIFSKLLGNRMQPLIPRIIDNDQVGFVYGREAWDNTIKQLH